MGGSDFSTQGLTLPQMKPADRQRIERAAAVHVADRIAAEHPDPRDDLMPKLAGRVLAKDPTVAADVRELLAALGLNKEQT